MSDFFQRVGQQGVPMPGYVSHTEPWKTKLTEQEEAQFQKWVQDNHIPFDLARPDAAQDYDMRGYWKAMMAGDPNAQRGGNLHFPDTWKTPLHTGFSNESIYATPDAPHWVGDKLFDKSGKLVKNESK